MGSRALFQLVRIDGAVWTEDCPCRRSRKCLSTCANHRCGLGRDKFRQSESTIMCPQFMHPFLVHIPSDSILAWMAALEFSASISVSCVVFVVKTPELKLHGMDHQRRTTCSGMVLSIYATCRAQRRGQPLGLDPVVQREGRRSLRFIEELVCCRLDRRMD